MKLLLATLNNNEMRIVILNLFILILLALTSCTKWQHQYPEDTERSKLTPMERLAGKTWTLQQVTLNGMDYTDSVFNQIGKFQINFGMSKISSMSNTNIFYVGEAKSDFEGNFICLYIIGDEQVTLGIIRENLNFAATKTLTILYINNNFSPRFGVSEILRLEEHNLKIRFRNSNNGGMSDSVITNTFVSN